MTRFTIRDAATLAAVAVHADLSDAVNALETERLAWQLNPPPGRDTLELVVTADDHDRDQDREDGGIGDVVVLFAAGGPATSAAARTGQSAPW